MLLNSDSPRHNRAQGGLPVWAMLRLNPTSRLEPRLEQLNKHSSCTPYRLEPRLLLSITPRQSMPSTCYHLLSLKNDDQH